MVSIYLSAVADSSEKSVSAEVFLLLFDLQDDARGSSSEDIGLGLWPIPDGCCKPADCSSVLRTAMMALMVASSTWDQGLDGALIRRKNKLCHLCLSCSSRLAACNRTPPSATPVPARWRPHLQDTHSLVKVCSCLQRTLGHLSGSNAFHSFCCKNEIKLLLYHIWGLETQNHMEQSNGRDGK